MRPWKVWESILLTYIWAGASTSFHAWCLIDPTPTGCAMSNLHYRLILMPCLVFHLRMFHFLIAMSDLIIATYHHRNRWTIRLCIVLIFPINICAMLGLTFTKFGACITCFPAWGNGPFIILVTPHAVIWDRTISFSFLRSWDWALLSIQGCLIVSNVQDFFRSDICKGLYSLINLSHYSIQQKSRELTP